MCVLGDYNDYYTPDDTWSVRGVLDAVIKYADNEALVNDAVRVLVDVARGLEARIVEAEKDLGRIAPAMTTAFQRTMTRLGGDLNAGGAKDVWPLTILGYAAKCGDPTVGRVFLGCGAAAVAVAVLNCPLFCASDQLPSREFDRWEATTCAWQVLESACLAADRAGLHRLVAMGAVDAVRRTCLLSALLSVLLSVLRSCTLIASRSSVLSAP